MHRIESRRSLRSGQGEAVKAKGELGIKEKKYEGTAKEKLIEFYQEHVSERHGAILAFGSFTSDGLLLIRDVNSESVEGQRRRPDACEICIQREPAVREARETVRVSAPNCLL